MSAAPSIAPRYRLRPIAMTEGTCALPDYVMVTMLMQLISVINYDARDGPIAIKQNNILSNMKIKDCKDHLGCHGLRSGERAERARALRGTACI